MWQILNDLMSMKNGMNADWSKKASLRPSAAGLVWKSPIPITVYVCTYGHILRNCASEHIENKSD